MMCFYTVDIVMRHLSRTLTEKKTAKSSLVSTSFAGLACFWSLFKLELASQAGRPAFPYENYPCFFFVVKV